MPSVMSVSKLWVQEPESAENFAMDNFEKECSIRGYDVYKEILESAIGEELDCRRGPSNAVD